VKPEFMELFFKKILLVLAFVCLPLFCFAQKEKKISVGVSTDYGFGKDINNYASTIKLNYYLFKEFRISPSFSHYLNKEHMKMNIFSFNFHYMLPNLVSHIFPVMENNGLCFYPVVGFCIADVDQPRKRCATCSEYSNTSGANYVYNFGFDFGAGIDYELPTLLPVLRNMTASFEIQYQAIENYGRPQLLFGIMYDF
jgi:hypothetical protein